MDSRDKLLPTLHEVQEGSGAHYLPASELGKLRRRFGLSRAELRGVASYYSLLSLEPRGRHVIRLCVSPVCRMIGSLDLLAVIKKELGVGIGGTTADGLFTLEETQCLGRCAGAPAMMIDDRGFERLDEARVKRILEAFRKGGVEADVHAP